MKHLLIQLLLSMVAAVGTSTVTYAEGHSAACTGIAPVHLAYADSVFSAFGEGAPASLIQNSETTIEAMVPSALLGLGVGNASWNPMHPKWNELALVVRKDLTRIFREATAALNTTITLAAVRCSYAKVVSADDLKALVEYFKSDTGKRYLAFGYDLQKVVAVAMSNAALARHGSPPTSSKTHSTPTPALVQARLDVIQSSLVVGTFQSMGNAIKRNGGETSVYALMGYIYADMVQQSGEPFDELGSKYSSDLKSFRSFVQSEPMQMHGEGMVAIAALPAYAAAQAEYIGILLREGTKSELEWKRIFQENVAAVSNK